MEYAWTVATDDVRQYKKYILDFMYILKLFDSITDQWVIDKEPRHTSRFFVGRQKNLHLSASMQRIQTSLRQNRGLSGDICSARPQNVLSDLVG